MALKDKVVGFTCGVMDLLHPGHLIMLKECRKQCDFLIVGLQENARPGKEIPVETYEERLIRLKACKYVDKIIHYNTEEDLYSLLKELRPNVRFVGADHKNKPFTGDDLLIPIIYNSRNHDYSSSNLRQRLWNTRERI